ncbi:hypothetical protein [Tateyamaria sp. SN3-11]|uniref:hypothetical protein n=1 Tax=Tateyamaria sp. SN3-11 TaxID=3092147 RepID=UPI0039EB19D5
MKGISIAKECTCFVLLSFSVSYQLCQIIRLGKFYSKTHASRLSREFLGGLLASALFIAAFVATEGLDDEAFRETIRVISYRSKCTPVYANSQQVSDDQDTDRIQRLIDEAKSAANIASAPLEKIKHRWRRQRTCGTLHCFSSCCGAI